METDSEKVKEFVYFQIHRNVVNLYKRYLNIVEDLQRDNSVMLSKVEQRTSKEFAQDINHFDTEKYNYIRKKILDLGNETIRELEKNFEMIDVKIK